MNPSEKQGSQQKKSRKSIPSSRRSTGVAAMAAARTGVPHGGLGTASGATPPSSCAGSGGGTNSPQAPPSAFWSGSSSEWLYPPGGFVNSLQMPYPYVHCPNDSQLPENSHFVGNPN
ncbi:unnamed protein product [Urochloa humidicola]